MPTTEAKRLQELMEAAARAPSFRGKDLMREIAAVLPGTPRLHEAYETLLSAWMPPAIGSAVFAGLVRWAFFIELVKRPKIETTKFETRWGERLGAADPRYALYDECLELCVALTTEAVDSLGDDERRRQMEMVVQRRLLPYELPIDYRARPADGSRIHIAGNAEWLWGDRARAPLLLRNFLLSDEVGLHLPTFAAAYAKIRVKTYLTDRVLTGAHKTNREKRWETHPESVHFALRRDCLDIERRLVEQLCAFEGFPPEIADELDAAGLVSRATHPFRCPITLDPLGFAAFEGEIGNPTAGRSSFQVGHLNPLKATNDDPRTGHTVDNVSWVSADGNRIQGSLTLDATRELVRRMVRNYEALGEV